MGWEVRDIVLEITPARLANRRFAQSDDAGLTWTQMADKALDYTILPCGITTLDQNEDLIVAADDVLLKLYDFDLQAVEGLR